jgi:dihydrofolate reductase
MKKTLSIIVAIAEDNGIGYKNQLLTHLSEDLKYFKSVTAGHTVVMGRNTWLSLPKRPLPNRLNIVISNIPSEKLEGATTVYSIDEAISACPDAAESFIIGGAMIYKQFFPFSQKLYITQMFKTFEADTFFPEITEKEWLTESKSEIFSDEKSGLKFQFIIFNRKN